MFKLRCDLGFSVAFSSDSDFLRSSAICVVDGNNGRSTCSTYLNQMRSLQCLISLPALVEEYGETLAKFK